MGVFSSTRLKVSVNVTLRKPERGNTMRWHFLEILRRQVPVKNASCHAGLGLGPGVTVTIEHRWKKIVESCSSSCSHHQESSYPKVYIVCVCI